MCISVRGTPTPLGPKERLAKTRKEEGAACCNQRNRESAMQQIARKRIVFFVVFGDYLQPFVLNHFKYLTPPNFFIRVDSIFESRIFNTTLLYTYLE